MVWGWFKNITFIVHFFVLLHQLYLRSPSIRSGKSGSPALVDCPILSSGTNLDPPETLWIYKRQLWSIHLAPLRPILSIKGPSKWPHPTVLRWLKQSWTSDQHWSSQILSSEQWIWRFQSNLGCLFELEWWTPKLEDGEWRSRLFLGFHESAGLAWPAPIL